MEDEAIPVTVHLTKKQMIDHIECLNDFAAQAFTAAIRAELSPIAVNSRVRIIGGSAVSVYDVVAIRDEVAWLWLNNQPYRSFNINNLVNVTHEEDAS